MAIFSIEKEILLNLYTSTHPKDINGRHSNTTNFFAYLALTITIVANVWTRLNSLLAIAILVFAVTIPFIDAKIGRMQLISKCKQDNQITLKRSIPNVEGIYIQYKPFEDSPKYFGYKFIEGSGIHTDSISPAELIRLFGGRYTGFPVRRATAEGSQVIIEKEVESKSLYEILEEPRQDTYWYYSVRNVVRVRATKEELASFTWHSFRGGWAERIGMAFSDAGPRSVADCGNYDFKHKKVRELLHTALQPLNN